MTPHPGEFWVADIVFTDRTASKKRPILVLWLDGVDVVAAVVTSAMPRTSTDIALADWRTSGLRVASTVRLSRLDCLEHSLLLYRLRLDCLEHSLLLYRLGEITPADAQHVKAVWDRHVKPQF
jgi:mRNA interferase MazF